MSARPFVTSVLFAALVGVFAPEAAAQATRPPVKIPPLAPDVALRPFFLITAQRMAASDTFEAIFGSPVQPFWGGGAQLTMSNGFFVEGTISRFSKTGERAFVLDGEASSLGIPLDASIVPIEATAGYRFGADFSNTVTPYFGAGFASYKYTESSEFDDPGDAVSERGNGFLVVGGAEVRVHKWMTVSADVQYTQIGGVLGDGGLSKDLGEDNLGGIAARFRIIIGR
jgi:opacity protein-like surface antigen